MHLSTNVNDQHGSLSIKEMQGIPEGCPSSHPAWSAVVKLYQWAKLKTGKLDLLVSPS